MNPLDARSIHPIQTSQLRWGSMTAIYQCQSHYANNYDTLAVSETVVLTEMLPNEQNSYESRTLQAMTAMNIRYQAVVKVNL